MLAAATFLRTMRCLATLVCVMWVWRGSTGVAAQSATEERFKVAGAIALIRFIEFDSIDKAVQRLVASAKTKTSTWLEVGLAGEFSCRVLQHVWLDADLRLLPRYAGTSLVGGTYRGGAKALLLFGASLEKTSQSASISGAFRYGLASFEDLATVIAIVPGSSGGTVIVVSAPARRPAFEVSTKASLSLRNRLALDVQIADTIVRYGSSRDDLNPLIARHNVGLLLGVNSRF